MATAPLSSLYQRPEFPELQVLSHLEVDTPDDKIRIRGNSLLTGYVHVDEHDQPAFTDPKDAQWVAAHRRFRRGATETICR